MLDSTTVELMIGLGVPLTAAIIFTVRYVVKQGHKLDNALTRGEQVESTVQAEITDAHGVHRRMFERLRSIDVTVSAIQARLDERLPPRGK